MKRDRSTPRDLLPIVAIERPRCPSCRSVSIETRRSQRDHDNAVTRDVRCRVCGQRFFVVVE